MSNKDFYKLLELDENATVDQIKKIFVNCQ